MPPAGRPGPCARDADFTPCAVVPGRAYSWLLVACARSSTAALPPLEDVLALYQRRWDRRACDTSVLFPFFAQWFIDSFLRTRWKEPERQDFAENESNHEIDLCQIYGISAAQTDLLRAKEGGRLKSQTIGGEV